MLITLMLHIVPKMTIITIIVTQFYNDDNIHVAYSTKDDNHDYNCYKSLTSILSYLQKKIE